MPNSSISHAVGQGGNIPTNYYDAGNGQQHVYDQNWSYLFSQPTMNTSNRVGLASLNQASTGITPEPSPIPGAGGGGGIPGAGEPGGLGGTPVGAPPPQMGGGSNPFAGAQAGGQWNPFAGAQAGGQWGGTRGQVGGSGGNNYMWLGPGQVYGNAQPGGTNLAYQTGSYWGGPQLGWIARGQAANGGGNLAGQEQAWQIGLGLAGLGGNTSWNNAMRMV